MATKLQIANGALVKLGGRTISSLSGSEKEARLCNERFSACRQAVLRLHNWNFAKKRVELTTTTAAPAFGFSNAFELPDDYLRVIKVNEGDEEHAIENGLLLSDSSEIRLQYVYDIDGDAFDDALFCDALSCFLGHDIAYALTQSAETQERMYKLFDAAIRLAKHVGSTENSVSIVEAEDFLSARMTRGHFPRDPGT